MHIFNIYLVTLQAETARSAIHELLFNQLGSLNELTESEKGPRCLILKDAKISLGDECSAKVKSKYTNYASELKGIEEEVCKLLKWNSRGHLATTLKHL